MKRLTFLLTILLVGYLVYDYFKKKTSDKANEVKSVIYLENNSLVIEKFNSLENSLDNFRYETDRQLSKIERNADPNFINQSFDI